MISKFDMRMMAYAKAQAEKSDSSPHKLGCAIAYKKKLIALGHNKDKTHPKQKYYNKHRKFYGDNNIKHLVHAEIDAINSIPYAVAKDLDWSKVKVYVYREHKNGKWACSKPCPACFEAIKSLGIEDVYYTDEVGLGYMKVMDEKERENVR